MQIPTNPKLYHIVHVDRLASIIAAGLLSDAQMAVLTNAGSMIGMPHIKKRRLEELTLSSYPSLYVGQCVPFYFCPRSIMLYIISQKNHPDLDFKGGQTPIVHLQIDLHGLVTWANQQDRRWAFTLSNAGSSYFEDRNHLAHLNELNWSAIQTTQWVGCKEGKQAEFLLEHDLPWHLIEAIGVYSPLTHREVMSALQATAHKPSVTIEPNWYY
jgi:hypothetical protein